MITDVAQIIGGEHIEVNGLMGPGIDPHLYKASEGDVSTLLSADLILYNGLHLEAQMGEIFDQMSDQEIRTVAVADEIDQAVLISSATYVGQSDPHVWFDVTLWMQVTEKIRDTLIEMIPEHEAEFRANADAYLVELEQLHQYVTDQAELVPEEQRVLITAHDAFNYFGQQYGFEVRGLQGISTQSEASTADVQALVDFIIEREINAVFIESSVPVRNVEAVQAAVRARGHELEIGGELFSDAMGDPETEEGTYIGMVRHNINTIVAGLLGE
jgi:manganese/zinc/iron transport system substrate-binding protein